VTTDLLRRYARSLRGTRIADHTPCSHWQTNTVVAALRPTELTATAVFDGPIDNITFRAYVEQVLVPTLRPGDFDEVCELIAAALGLYMPDECANYVRHCGYLFTTRKSKSL